MLSATLKSELSVLSLEEKLEVFEVIRDSVMPSAEHSFPELSTAQERELLRRAAHAAANPGEGHSWAEVKQRLGK